MKRIFSISAAILILLTGCNNSTELSDTPTESTPAIVITETVTTSTTENEDPKGTTDIADAASSFSASKETEMTEPEETVSETKPSVTTEQPATTEKKETVSTTPTETKQSVTTTEPQKTQPKETEPPVTTEEPVIIPEVKRPSASEIEAKTAEYINQYRLAQGDTQTVILPGLTAVAEYRAKQLITNFSHADSADACTALQYGEFVDMTLYGCDASANYYQGYNREAIAKGNWGGTADEIAQRIATGFKNSSKHWNYVGSSEYGYMAVGVVYDSATSSWYVCICMSSKNYGG